MPSYAIVNIVGHLARDPVVRTYGGDKKIVTLTVPVSTKLKGQELTTWYDVTLWGRDAEYAEQFGGKGCLVAVTGRQHEEEYEAKDGSKRKKLVVNASNITFLTYKTDDKKGKVDPETGEVLDDKSPF